MHFYTYVIVIVATVPHCALCYDTRTLTMLTRKITTNTHFRQSAHTHRHTHTCKFTHFNGHALTNRSEAAERERTKQGKQPSSSRGSSRRRRRRKRLHNFEFLSVGGHDDKDVHEDATQLELDRAGQCGAGVQGHSRWARLGSVGSWTPSGRKRVGQAACVCFLFSLAFYLCCVVVSLCQYPAPNG